uniref:Uncharacterized protein n=1 Tax=Photinus pyralis TaxID=7054 RepID=A0A1Y1NMV6_PHOPY
MWMYDAAISRAGVRIVTKYRNTKYLGSITFKKRHWKSPSTSWYQPITGRKPMKLPDSQHTLIITKAVLVRTCFEYAIGYKIAQYRSIETANKQKMDTVHNTINNEIINRHPCKL